MLHTWYLIVLALCAVLATLALGRGLAGLLVTRDAFGRAEAAALALAGLVGWFGVVLVHRAPG
jgi:hypothetical protein